MRKPVALNWRNRPSTKFDVFVCAAGYESRAIHAAKLLGTSATKKIAVEFEDRRVLSYAANRDWLLLNGFVLTSGEFSFLASELEAAIADVGRDECRVAVDVSSMTRPLIARLVRYFANAGHDLEATFLYSPAVFVPPSRQVSPQTFSGPVISEYAGWTLDPSLPLAVIIGAGYEYGRALGILEYLEPAVAWVFNPGRISESYDTALRKVNAGLYDLLPRDQIIDYPVDETLVTYELLEALVNGLKRKSRVTLCPFGPKIFFLTSVIVAEAHRPDVTVWRVSGGSSETPTDHQASGQVIQLPIRFAEECTDSR